MAFEPTLRRDYEPAALLAAHPPKLKHPHKQLAFELACPERSKLGGTMHLSRWPHRALPRALELTSPALEVLPTLYDYRGSGPGVWHVNFADPQLFVAYGSALLAQDELQAVEHPLLGCVREALVAEKLPALTEDDSGPTPVLLANVERRCELQTAPDLDAGRLYGLYGNRFASATTDQVRSAVRVIQPPGVSHLIAIAAPTGRNRRGPYYRADLDRILLTAYSGFSAALVESGRLWPGSPVEVRTGFWGCGAFGGNRQVMIMLQLLAARLCGLSRLVLHTVDAAGEREAREAVAMLERCLAGGAPGGPVDALMERIADLDLEWGVSDGN